MPKRKDETFDPTPSPTPAAANEPVPQEHTALSPHDAPLPTDWSHLGRRVLAEAWQRTTDAVATRRASTATPAVPAPHAEGNG
jgi:hypothetical protein